MKNLIHNYAVTVWPDTRESALKMREMVTKIDKELRLSFLHYLISGKNLYTQTLIEEELEFPTNIGPNTYHIRLKKVGTFNLDNLELCQMDRNPIQLTFLNLLI